MARSISFVVLLLVMSPVGAGVVPKPALSLFAAGPQLAVASGALPSSFAPGMGVHSYHLPQRLLETGEVCVYLSSSPGASIEKPVPFTTVETTSDYNGAYLAASSSLQKLAVYDSGVLVDVGNGQVKSGLLAMNELIDSRFFDRNATETVFEARFYTNSQVPGMTDQYSGIFSAKGGTVKIRALHQSVVNTSTPPFNNGQIGPVYGGESEISISCLQINTAGQYAVAVNNSFINNDRIVINGTDLPGLPPGTTIGMKLNDSGSVAHLRASGSPSKTSVYVDSALAFEEGTVLPGIGLVQTIIIGAAPTTGDITFNNQGDLAVNATVVDPATGIPEDVVLARSSGGQVAALRFPAGAAPRIGGYFALNDGGYIVINAGSPGLSGEGAANIQMRFINYVAGTSITFARYFMADLFGPGVNRPIYAAINGQNTLAFAISPPDNAIATYTIGVQQSVSLHIDADNNNGFDLPDESAAEEAIKGDASKPGKKIPSNRADKNFNGVPDFAEFKANPAEKFVPMRLSVPNVDLSGATISFHYDAAPPSQVRAGTLPNGSPGIVGGPGTLRIWTKDGFMEDRDPAAVSASGTGTFVPSDVELPPSALGVSTAGSRSVVLFVEGIDEFTKQSLIQVRLTTGGGPPQTDSVVVTVVRMPDKLPAVPPAGSVSGSPTGWSLSYEVSPLDGLVLKDVMLNSRYMAHRMSIPYVELDLAGKHWRRELVPAGDGEARVQLVMFNAFRTRPLAGTAFPSEFVVAWYLVDQLPNSDQAVLIVQQYEFREADGADAVEPSGKLRAARFYPIANYTFLGALNDPPTVVPDVRIPQRCNFWCDGVPSNSSSLLKDNNLTGIPVIIKRQNPVSVEQIILPIVKGAQATLASDDWDNYHQTSELTVKEPTAFEFGGPYGIKYKNPGCTECVHIHWRWSSFILASFPDQNGGQPRIPLKVSSIQDVVIGLSVRKDGDLHPFGGGGWRDMVQNLPYPQTDQVFWYEGTGHTQSDAFFTHGGFFAPFIPPFVSLLSSVLSGQVGQTLTFSGAATDQSLAGLQASWDFGDHTSTPLANVSDPANITVTHVFTTPGTYVVTLFVVGPNGVPNTAEMTVTIGAPSTPVANAGPSRTVEQNTRNGAVVTLNGTASTSPDGSPLTYLWSGPFGTAAGPTPTVNLPLGTSLVTLSVQNSAGLASQAIVTLTVQDTLPPTLANVPASVQVEQQSLSGTVVVLVPPTASDICDAAPAVTSNAPGVFPLGTTVVTWTATDASGNQSTATTSVVVVDTTAPVLSSITATPAVLTQTASGGPNQREIQRLTLEIAKDERKLAKLQADLAEDRLHPRRSRNDIRHDEDQIEDLQADLVRDRARLALLQQGGGGGGGLVPVTVAVVASDVCDAAPVSQILSITNSQSSDALGGSVTTLPWGTLTGTLSASLEAATTGGAARVYTITIRCTDASGNSRTGTTTVTVAPLVGP